LNYLNPPGFLGNGASLLADVTLLAYILLLLPGMVAGFYFARAGKHRPDHRNVMIGITAINWVFILWVMVAALTFDVTANVAQQPGNARYLFPAIHGALGLTAQLLATYTVYRMIREDVQVARAKQRGETQLSKYWFKSAKPVMRIVLLLWIVTATIGIVTYLVRYEVVTIPGGAAPSPVVTLEVEPPIATETVETPVSTPEASPEAPPEILPPVETSEVAETDEITPPAETPEVTQAATQIAQVLAVTEQETPLPAAETPELGVVETGEALPPATTRPPTSTLRPTSNRTVAPVETPEVGVVETVDVLAPVSTGEVIEATATATRRPPTRTPRRTPTPTPAGDPLVLLGGNDELGAFLIDPEGRTLYVYANDEPNWSNCTGACLNNWEVYEVDADTPLVVGAGLDGELGLTERADGTYQVTYDEKPLYYFALDRHPGDAIGNGAGNVWSVVLIEI
jgi:predicted lipoprotein with Yx(FWY)xxD motif/uncharacterized membrane protein YozB (DUF420 family)